MAKNILYLDDDEALLRLGEVILQSLDYQPILAKTKDEAIEIIQKGGVDLLLSDTDLSVENEGIDLCRKLRQNGYKFPIVGVSGKPSEERISAWHIAGADGFLPKPYSFPKLESLLSELLRDERSQS